MHFNKTIVLLLAGGLAACTGGGPRTSAIVSAPNATVVSRDQADPFALVEVNRAVAEYVSAHDSRDKSFFPDTGSGAVIIGVGDELEISIVSTSENGFVDFTTTSVSPISTTQLPRQEVGASGSVNVPPLGRVRAAGSTVQQFEAILERRLGEVLVDPSVIVRLADRRSARVAVMGQVADPGTVSINEYNARMVDMIAAAGGPTARAEDLEVSVSRNGRTEKVLLASMYESPRYNVHAAPGDVISVETPSRRVTVLGAGGRNQTLHIDEPRVTLADTLGRSGGLLNRRADRQGVFLYRQSPREVVKALGAQVDAIPGAAVPTIYRFDLTEPSSLFTANAFEVADGDILYISDNLNEEINAVVGAVTTFVPAPAEYVSDATIGN